MQPQIETSQKNKMSTLPHDEVLAELWATKAQLNHEANFALDTLIERARDASRMHTKDAKRIRVG